MQKVHEEDCIVVEKGRRIVNVVVTHISSLLRSSATRPSFPLRAEVSSASAHGPDSHFGYEAREAATAFWSPRLPEGAPAGALTIVSLIGVNLPWAHAPYLQQLRALELALHSDNIRPPFEAWDAILQRSPCDCITLAPARRTRTSHTTLRLCLSRISIAGGNDFGALAPHRRAPTSPPSSLECSLAAALAALQRALVSLSVLELDLSRIRDPRRAAGDDPTSSLLSWAEVTPIFFGAGHDTLATLLRLGMVL
ncbi:hypothetical protein B0H12DRAFT_1243311 [Mycena haematopus]|nr:hypothetical protein B0H12DRAFT_1243311 [Mycena haematopus]